VTTTTVLDLAPWIAEYQCYLHAYGFKARAIRRRLKHLRCFREFIQSQGLTTLENFLPRQTVDFVDYWIRHSPGARVSPTFTAKSIFWPPHHHDLQYSLHAFFRWAQSTGRLSRVPLVGHNLEPRIYAFPEMAEYLHFCAQHKGLAQNYLLQIEVGVGRFDQFLCSVELTSWKQLHSRHIDLFVRQQADSNIGRIQRIHGILRGLFRYLFRLGRVDRDWAEAIVSPRRYNLAHSPRALSAEQVLTLLAGIDRHPAGGKRDFAIILMAASLGVRVSEIAALRLEDIDWQEMTVRFPPIKSKNWLPMPLSRPLREALADYLQHERPSGSAYRNVFLRWKAPLLPMTAPSVSKLVAKRMRQAGIQSSAHRLRHAFASDLLRAGTSYTTLQELLGHTNFSSTQIYTKIDLRQLQEVADNDSEDF
jgi:integrase/recombinase XerD